ncbi:hypothetical protein G6F62_014046 [Rhizopus arrhizus]|nr:hypothetical protein G6F62_014046 [Rhizopus arrhizus]
MPVLRLQFPRRAGRNPRTRLSGCVAQRPGTGAAGYLGPPGRVRLHRWRHAQPVPAGSDRPLPAAGQRAPALRAQCRDHPGNQPGHRRTRPLRPLPRGRREPPQLRHPEFRRRDAQAPGPHPRQWRGRARGEDGAGRGLRQFQHRPDVRAAGTDPGRRRGRS